MRIYKRWRHSRGFGVHSPFAYALVREGLRLSHGYAFYADEDPRILPQKGRKAGSLNLKMRAEVLLRLLVFLRQTIFDHSEISPTICFRSVETDSPARFAIRTAGYTLLQVNGKHNGKHAGTTSVTVATAADIDDFRSAVGASDEFVNEFEGAARAGACVYIFNDSGDEFANDIESVMVAAGYGLLIKSRRYLLAILRREMTFTSYEIL